MAQKSLGPSYTKLSTSNGGFALISVLLLGLVMALMGAFLLQRVSDSEKSVKNIQIRKTVSSFSKDLSALLNNEELCAQNILYPGTSLNSLTPASPTITGLEIDNWTTPKADNPDDRLLNSLTVVDSSYDVEQVRMELQSLAADQRLLGAFNFTAAQLALVKEVLFRVVLRPKNGLQLPGKSITHRLVVGRLVAGGPSICYGEKSATRISAQVCGALGGTFNPGVSSSCTMNGLIVGARVSGDSSSEVKIKNQLKLENTQLKFLRVAPANVGALPEGTLFFSDP